MKKRVRVLLAFAIGLPFVAYGGDSACLAVDQKKKGELVEYVRKKYKIPLTVTLDLAKDKAVSGSCFRELTFQGKSPLRTWDLTLFLSPDQRFLSAELLDTNLDPIQEAKRQALALAKDLTQGNVPVRGSSDAPITIVEFSDFQCSFCAEFNRILENDILPRERKRIRLAFRHFPLSMHNWARAAAEGAACAQLQTSDSFWSIHDQLFKNQASITPENIQEKLLDYAKSARGLDLTSFKSCLENHMSLGLVLRDTQAAALYQVNATPTIFVNGTRLEGVSNADELRRATNESQLHSSAN